MKKGTYIASSSDSDINNFIILSLQKIFDKLKDCWLVVISDVECQLFEDTLEDEKIPLAIEFTNCWIIPSHDLRVNRFHKSILSKNLTFIQNVKYLINEFKSLDEKLHFNLFDINCNEINWNQACHLTDNCNNNFNLMRQIGVQDNVVLTPRSTRLIYDSKNVFRAELKDFCLLPKIFCEQQMLFKDMKYQSDSVNFWYHLYLRFDIDECQPIINIVIDEFEKCPFLITANYLHPLHKKAAYAKDLISVAKNFITEYAIRNCPDVADVLKAFIDYSDEKNSSVYSQFLNIEGVCKDPILFWEMCKEQNKGLQKLAMKLINISCNLPKIGETRNENYEMNNNEKKLISDVFYNLLLNGNLI